MIFRIFRLAAISGMLVTAAACIISYSQQSSQCDLVIAQQKASTGYAVNWNKAISEVGLGANLTIQQLEAQFPQTCDPDTTKDLLNCGLLGILVFAILFIPLALMRFVLSVVRE